MRRERSAGLAPSLLVSALLHGGVAALFLMVWEQTPKEVELGKVVPVTLVINSTTTNLRPAVAADEPAPAQTETPEPDASPTVPAPAVEPEPSPPTPTPPTPKPAPPPKAATPTPAPTPTPKPAPARPAPTPPTKAAPTPQPKATPRPTPAPTPTPKPAPAPKAPTATPTPPARPQPAPAPPSKSAASTPSPTPPAKSAQSGARPAAKAPTERLDLDALAESLAASSKAASGRPRTSGQQGPARPPTAAQAQPDAGTAEQVAAVGAMKEDIERLWNPNCEVEGGDRVTVRVRFTLNSAGAIVGKVDAGGQEDAADEVTRVAADRAIRAVYQASPFPRLPPSYYNQRLTLNFKASDACRR